MKREFTPKQLKELREVNPRLTNGLFNDIIKDLNEDYSIYIFDEGYSDAYAFYEIKWAIEDIKVVSASHLLNDARNYPLIKVTETKYRDFERYCTFNADDFIAKDENYYLNELASLFKEAFTNVYRVYVDEETKKIAFAFWS